jgi:putative spermidine/putrescine transport system permease protein
MPSSFAPEPGREPGGRAAEVEETQEAAGGLVPEEAALGAKPTRGVAAGKRITTAGWAAPGTFWLLFFLLAPVVMILLVSAWAWTPSGFEQGAWTLDNYRTLFGSAIYWEQLRESAVNSVIVVAACLIFGFPVAYFLAIHVKNLRNQIAFFIIALAPFWTSYLIRAVAWLPMMGRQGAINTILEKLGIIGEPLDILLFSSFAVTLAMIQLYILFMIAPIFFMLAQIDRSSLESSRDLGANWFKTFREVILPQSMPGIVIGSIFVFVLTMGEYGTVRIIGGGRVSSVGVIVNNNVIGVQYPQAATSAVFLVLAMMVGVFVLLRFSNLREEL